MRGQHDWILRGATLGICGSATKNAMAPCLAELTRGYSAGRAGCQPHQAHSAANRSARLMQLGSLFVPFMYLRPLPQAVPRTIIDQMDWTCRGMISFGQSIQGKYGLFACPNAASSRNCGRLSALPCIRPRGCSIQALGYDKLRQLISRHDEVVRAYLPRHTTFSL